MGATNANEEITLVKNVVLPGKKIYHFLSFPKKQHLSFSVKCPPPPPHPKLIIISLAGPQEEVLLGKDA